MISALDALKIKSSTLEHCLSQIETEIIKMRKAGNTSCYWWYNQDESSELPNIVDELRHLGYDVEVDQHGAVLLISIQEYYDE